MFLLFISIVYGFYSLLFIVYRFLYWVGLWLWLGLGIRVGVRVIYKVRFLNLFYITIDIAICFQKITMPTMLNKHAISN